MTTVRNTIVISNTAGDPNNPKTWSGTPANIIKTLSRNGFGVISINTSLPKPLKLACFALHYAGGLKSNYLRGPLAHRLRARILQRRLETIDCRKVLHTGTGDLPMPDFPDKADHYLLIDYTWNLFVQNSPEISRYPRRMLRLAEELEHQSYAQITHFFPVSQYVANNLVGDYGIDPARITVVGTGRGNIAPFTGEKNYAKGHILFVAKGGFEKKGGLSLIEGFSIAQRKNSKLRLVIVGGQKYEKFTKDVPNVTLTGYLTLEELERLFHTAALFAMPALNEPWGLVYLEALASRTPILGLNRNSVPEISCNGRYGFLVPEPTSASVANVILQAFSDVDKLREMGKNGQRYCLEKFSWENTCDKITRTIFGQGNSVRKPADTRPVANICHSLQ